METLSKSEKIRSKSSSPDRNHQKHQGKRVYIKFSQFTIEQLNELYKKVPLTAILCLKDLKH